ncbi:MAG: ATPase [Flavobacteriales bacterium]|nr:ATPase [Flavobacteriales bacterium]
MTTNNTYFLGVDIGSSFTKLIVIDKEDNIVFSQLTKTLNRDKEVLQNILKDIDNQFDLENICATGYGRKHFKKANITKTEIHCSSIGLNALFPEEKTIIDIGGEDIKVIKSSDKGKVEDFYMNTKCAAGTGTFITEIAERAELDLSKMSELAAQSEMNKELNSFCTVFAKTEIMKWIFDEMPEKDLARGIYISIVNRIAKLKMDSSVPIYLIGGVAEFHPFLTNIMEEMFKKEIIVPNNPQMTNAFGAAIAAKNQYKIK